MYIKVQRFSNLAIHRYNYCIANQSNVYQGIWMVANLAVYIKIQQVAKLAIRNKVILVAILPIYFKVQPVAEPILSSKPRYILDMYI